MSGNDVRAEIARRKAQLDAARPLSPEALAQLEHWYDVRLTYTSNAIEGNTLTHAETALVIEKGITVAGKPLLHHNEAVDHYAAVRTMREIAARGRPITEADVLRLHEIVLRRSRPQVAGRYADGPRRTAGSSVVLPAAHKLPDLMHAFGRDLEGLAGWEGAFEAHYGLVTIHPFADGNGRTSRLLMNLRLLKDGYPPVSIGPEDKPGYLSVLERRQIAEPLGHGAVDPAARDAYSEFMAEHLLRSMRDYVEFLGLGEPRRGPRRDPAQGPADTRRGQG